VDVFINTLDQQKFRATNTYWNYLRLNDPWSVGYVSNLIEAVVFNSKEEWEAYYYQLGVKRNEIIAKQFVNYSELLNDHTLKRKDSNKIKSLSWELKKINFHFGRTKEQLAGKGRILFNCVTEKGITISLNECIECIRFRTICETWNGIIIRERNTIRQLEKIFKNIEFVKTNGDFDHKYAVDYELKFDGHLVCGIQVKPKSYTYNTSYTNKAKQVNKRKNLDYKTTFGKVVFEIISNIDGTIINSPVLKQIQYEIDSFKK